MCQSGDRPHAEAAKDVGGVAGARERRAPEMQPTDPAAALVMLAEHGPNERIVKLFRKKGDWHINGEEIDFGKYQCVGHGSICSVFKAKFRNSNVAVKVLRLVDDTDSSSPKPAPKSFALDFEQELKVVSMRLSHAHVVKFVGAGLTQLAESMHPVLLYEYLGGGSMEGYIDTKAGIHSGQGWQPPRQTALVWCQQLCSAVAYLHKISLAHRDIKPANVLVTKDHKTVKLADFSLACPLQDAGSDISHIPSVAGSLRYMAPEVTFKAAFDLEKADVYSAALTCWFMLFGRRPFWEHEPRMALCVAAQGQRPQVPPSDMELSVCLHSAWEVAPQKRPAAAAFAKTLSDLLSKCKNPSSASWASKFSSKIRSFRSSRASLELDDPSDAGEDHFISAHLRHPAPPPGCHSAHKPNCSLPQLVSDSSSSWRRIPSTASDKSFSVSSVGNGHMEGRVRGFPVPSPRSVQSEASSVRSSYSKAGKKKKMELARLGFD